MGLQREQAGWLQSATPLVAELLMEENPGSRIYRRREEHVE